LWENNEYDKAITEYTYALEMKPENSEALLGRGDAYYFNEEYGKAIADYTRALEIDPDNTEALMWRGRAYSNNVEYGKALSDFKKALRFAEDVDDTGTIAEAYEDLGYTYYRDENYDKAILFFEKYIALGHRNDIVYMNCGQAHILNGYFDKGNEYLYRVTELDSDSEKAIEKFRNNAAENRAANGGSQSKRQIVITIPNDWKGVLEKLWDLKETNNSISFHTVKDAKKYFNFEPNHPVAMGAYAMSEIKPENYVSLSSFHNYCQSIKFKAFLELCASLGALEIYIESAEINNRKIDLQAGASKGLLGEFAGSYSSKKNASSGEVLAFTFSEENSVMQDYNTPWLESEPTWREMRDRRKMFFAKTFEVEFNYTNDYGINGDLSVKLLDCSLDIGGSFHEMTEVRIKYKVVFW
jgi:tetratricopeptide (TPR) repeat protein